MTNAKGFPEAIARAMATDDYDKGHAKYSVTELISPARQAQLKRIHKHEIIEDVEDQLYRFYGKIVHSILEKGSGHGELAEKRFYALFAGVIVSTQIDTLELVSGKLRDYKFTTAWKFKGNQAPPEEWIAQLNMQAEILRQNGFTVNDLGIIGLIRDHSKLEAKRNADYPQAPFQNMAIPMWDRNKTVHYILGRIKAHDAAAIELPDCSDEERWAKAPVWAVMKEGGKRAVKLYGEELPAQRHAEFLSKSKGPHHVVYRPGENVRCANYCSPAPHCLQFQSLKPIESGEVLDADSA